MASGAQELANECKRQSDNCLYTSTALFIWLRFLRWGKALFTAVPLILGSLATWNLLTSSDLSAVRLTTAVLAFIAGLLPAIYRALKCDDHLEQCKHLAAEFKNLQDRFRQAALVSSRGPYPEFDAEFKALMERMEKARSFSVTAPEWCFKRAQRKIKSGDYDFDVDLAQ